MNERVQRRAFVVQLLYTYSTDISAVILRMVRLSTIV